MKYRIHFFLLLAGVLAAVIGCSQPAPTPTQVAVATATVAPTATDTPVPPTPTETATPTETPSPTVTLTPSTTPTPSETPLPRLIVQVVDEASGDPVFGATVTVTVQSLNFAFSQETGESGETTFTSLSVETYPLAASAPGYESFSGEVVVIGGEQVETLALAPVPPPEIFGEVLQSNTNLRYGPGTQFGVVVKLAIGEQVQMVGRGLSGDWILVETEDGERGWVSMSLIGFGPDEPFNRIPQVTPMPTPSPTPRPEIFGTVTADNANVRDGAGVDNAVVTQLQAGDRVRVLGVTEDELWVFVRAEDGTEGWLFVAVLEIDGDLTPLLTPTPGAPPAGGGGAAGTPVPGVTGTPPPAGTPISIAPTPARPGPIPFAEDDLRTSMENLRTHLQQTIGVFDRLNEAGVNDVDCAELAALYGQLIASPTYSDVPEAWQGVYGEYVWATENGIAAAEPIFDTCRTGGTLSQFNYSFSRSGLTDSLARLNPAIDLADQLLGQ